MELTRMIDVNGKSLKKTIKSVDQSQDIIEKLKNLRRKKFSSVDYLKEMEEDDSNDR